ncbi:hypothetical protein H8E07_07750, partial [bacterium]|nr:hypothetical protein [bacterium]
MSRSTLLVVCLACAVLPFVACDEDTSAPPSEDPFVPLLDGDWTLRVSPEAFFDPFLVAGSFTATEDSVFFTTPLGTYGGDITARQVDLDFQGSADGEIVLLFTSLTVARDGASLTGSFGGIPRRDGPAGIPGTLFAEPGVGVPEIRVSISPSTTT